ncbi:hypothetical protein PSQ39_21305 [Curvibacter sp. HBC28]|uniref:Uncharacterized protein n=1 Tax=Curvibacter microcysteis TaxID=3026419 RepID=A0ABT5MPM4_9BURK|nr:hypothetical protein [Curvibacter sp. HBC28]MDD0817186.1 hypothetical protein [Curvibacter sp. HBC28]
MKVYLEQTLDSALTANALPHAFGQALLRAHISSALELFNYTSPDTKLSSLSGLTKKHYVEVIIYLLWLLKNAIADESKTDSKRLEMATGLVAAMISSTHGDIGGRDQARQFAEIALDMVDALESKESIRVEGGAA